MNAPLVAAALAGALCCLLFVGSRAGWWSARWLEQAELQLIDARFRLRGPLAADDSIVIVGLDDQARREAPRIFTQRREWARLIDTISAAEPAAIGIDSFFAAPEVNLSRATVEQVRSAAAAVDSEARSAPLTGAGQAARQALAAVLDELSGDQRLATAIARARHVVLAYHFFLAEDGDAGASSDEPEAPQLRGGQYDEAVVVDQPRHRRPPRATSVAASLPAVAAGQRRPGYVNVAIDGDSAVRRAYLVVEHANRYYAPFALAVAREGRRFADLTYVTGGSDIHFGDGQLPVDGRGTAYIGFLGPQQTFETVSAADVLSGSVEPHRLKNKLVFIGRMDTTVDRYPTPFDELMPGVEIHATTAHNALHDQFLRRAHWLWTLAAMIVLGALVAAMQLRAVRGRRAWVVGVGSASAFALYAAAAYIVFGAGLLIDMAAPLATVTFVALVSMTAGLATEGREKAQLRSVFSQYVERKLVDQIVADPGLAQLGGERRELTVLFSDVRGFSRFSEGLAPEVLSQLLNDYLTPMTRLVMDQGGMLDKYIGDAVMAVYGAPIDQADHAVRACRTALAMQKELHDLNSDFRARDLPDIAIGIGINSGPMAVGNMGSEARFDYTVMGDAVNLGSRLEGLSKAYQCPIIVGQRTRDLVGETMAFREIDLVRVPGRDAPERIFELLGTPDRPAISPADVERFESALGAYRDGRWDQARTALAGFLDQYPADGPAHVLKERVSRLAAHPPAAWDGIFDHVSK